MGMQQNAWMTRWLFESWISHFLEYLKAGPGIDHTNRHLLILDGHNSHVTLEVVKVSMQSDLDIISLPSHTSHALQPLDVTCFKPFKTAFRRCRNQWALENSKQEVKKQDLCEWTSRALRVALTPKNIIAGFQATGIWPLNRTAVSDKLHATTSFEPDEAGACDGPADSAVTEPAGRRGAATRDGEAAASHWGQATGPAGTADWATVSVAGDQQDARGGNWATKTPHSASDPDSADSNDAEARLGTNNDVDDLDAEVHVSSPCHDENTRPLHFYVDVPEADESTYPACDRSVGIDPGFHAQLREDDNHDISSFLVLPELIPARKRKRQQPLLDFTRSKILTSEAYTEGCEHLLAQREANQEQARHRAVDREATKEQRRKEKEEKHLQVQARKEARAAKKVETERLQAE